MWSELEREGCLEAWVAEDEPTVEEELAVAVCMEALAVDPRPPESDLLKEAVSIFPEGRRIDVPNTDLVSIYYGIFDALHAIHWLWIKRI